MFLTRSRFSQRLLSWYDRHRRDLPWRVARHSKPDPYHVLLSEAMLQQTQVKTVIPYFQTFIQRWPSLEALAEADEQQVLRVWQGLGYYSRARNLLATARQIVSDHKSQIPRDVESLLMLRGIGRYTAGAVASIAFDTRAPILDGNVIRVLCRIDKIKGDPREPKTQKRLWLRAEELLPPKRCGDFNSALMELGATVCTPRSPACLICPVQKHCEAFAAGVQEQLPIRRQRQPSPLHRRFTFCVHRKHGDESEWLVEQRPLKGRWPGLWQFITTEAQEPPATARTVAAATGVKVGSLRPLGTIEHALTHRRYHFTVYVAGAREGRTTGPIAVNRRWMTLHELHKIPLPRPHVRILEMLASTLSSKAE